jgi:uncharacterized protein
VDVDTPRGPARAHLHPVDGARGAVVLGHGAGGGVGAADLLAATAAAHDAGASVALVEQPYRVAGRRSAPPAAHLDEAWVAVLAALRAGPFAGLPVVTGGRSSGARVACRTATTVGAAGVLCLAFPLQPPARASGTVPPSRQPELDGAGVPVLVVQGDRDRFGAVAPAPGRDVVVLGGDHALRREHDVLRARVGDWLRAILAA